MALTQQQQKWAMQQELMNKRCEYIQSFYSMADYSRDFGAGRMPLKLTIPHNKELGLLPSETAHYMGIPVEFGDELKIEMKPYATLRNLTVPTKEDTCTTTAG